MHKQDWPLKCRAKQEWMAMANWLARVVWVMFATVCSVGAAAHSGGLNAQGCHGGSRPYHCHRAPSEMVGNRLRCDLGSRSKECIGRSSSANTSRDGSRSQTPALGGKAAVRPEGRYIRDLSALPRHIDESRVSAIQTTLKVLGHYRGRVDGIFGAETALAMDVFCVGRGLPVGRYFDTQTLQALGLDDD